MKSLKHIFNHLRRKQALTPVLVVGMLMFTGAVVYNFNAFAAVASFSFTSSASSYQVGTTFNVNVYEDSGSQCANVVQADFTYPADLLRFNSASATGSKFESVLPANSGNGSISLQQYTTRKECGTGATATSGVSGEQLIGTVSFTVIAAGSATLSFQPSSTAVSSADNKTNVAPNRVNKTYSLTAAPTTTSPQPSPTPTPTSTAPRPAAKPVSLAVTTITPSQTDQSVSLANNDIVEVTTPVDVQPTPIQSDGISKIEYYLNGKLQTTVKKSPYTYKLDTTKLLNGTYTMTTKTFYANGQFKSVSQTVIVKNKFGITQLKLRLQKLAWLIVLLIVLAGAALAAWLIHRNNDSDDGPSDDSTYEADTSYAPDDAPLVTPTNQNINPGESDLSQQQYPQIRR